MPAGWGRAAALLLVVAAAAALAGYLGREEYSAPAALVEVDGIDL
eukprot:CAMPEP_0172026670 /NCGR_PEP_ID=MMETSP1041-20130122/16576_1 /TAXON_ID=464988 /ORGANISM="Hemiselmis andersenii, Strain CCMP439" /LENGTH=44 /DNA_ID= /DNA_START= /DNA_END= /DNA_ORIENTATION=